MKKFMNLTAFKKHFKSHPLLHTVVLSTALHFGAFIVLPTWQSPSKPDREKAIKIKYVKEKKVLPQEKVLPEPEKIKERKMKPPQKIREIITPNLRPKSAIIKNVKVVSIPPSAKRNPVPIRNSEKLFKPVNTVLKHTSMPHPVSEFKGMTLLDKYQAMRPSLRLNREAIQNHITPVPVTKLALQSRNLIDTLNKNIQNKPVPQHINSSAFKKITSQNSTVAIHPHLPATLGRVASAHQPVERIKNTAIDATPSLSNSLRAMQPQILNKRGKVVRAGKSIFKPMAKTGQTVGVRPQAPQSLDSELVAHYQPAIQIAATHFTSPVSGNSLLKKATIPPGFSDDKLNQGKEVTPQPDKKTARLENGVSNLPSDLLNQIKNGISAKIRNRIAHVKYYPRIARSRGFEGQPVVAFTLGNEGELLELSIINPSPFKLLDEAALDAVKTASPYPPIPGLLKVNSMKFNLPISFMLEER